MQSCSFLLRILVTGGAVVVGSAFTAGGAIAQDRPRLVWDQPASSAEELAGLAFVAYVDGRRQRLPAVTCAAEPGPDGYECASALPLSTPGEHVVEIAAHMSTGPRSEGHRSAAIRIRLGDQGSVDVAAARMAGHALVPSGDSAEPGAGAESGHPSASQAFERTWTTSDGVRLQAAVLASGLEDPTDLLPLPDGGVLVAERGGRVRVFRDGVLLAVPAVTLDDVAVGDGRGLLAMALDRDFPATRHVFAIYTTNDGLRLARFTALEDRLVDHAVLLEGLPVAAARPAAVLRTGPDGRVYLALDDGGDPERLHDRGSYSGKVLRLALDGTTPDDQPGTSPVWSVGVSRPAGLSWSVERTTLRLVGEPIDGARQEAFPPASDTGGTVTRLTLPPDVGGSRATVGIGAFPSVFRDNLLIASIAQRGILRVWFASGDVPAGSEWLLRDLPGPVAALAVAPDGFIYAAVGTALLRIVGE